MMAPRIIFHGDNAACFHQGIAGLLPAEAETIVLPDQLVSDAERRAYSTADVIVAAA